jgi:colicin import membrane protein
MACAAANIEPLIATGRQPHHPSWRERFAAMAQFRSVVAAGVSSELLIEKAEQYALAKAGISNPLYLKMPSNWLRDQGWLEDPQPPKPKKPHGAEPKSRRGSKGSKPTRRKKKVGRQARSAPKETSWEREERQAREAEWARRQEAERVRQQEEWARKQEAERQKQAELALQREAERQRQAEIARQQEAERQRQAELAREQELAELAQLPELMGKPQREIEVLLLIANQINKLLDRLDEIEREVKELFQEAALFQDTEDAGDADLRLMFPEIADGRSLREHVHEHAWRDYVAWTQSIETIEADVDGAA